MDFTLKTYRNLLQTLIKQGYTFQTYAQFITAPAPKAIILRHDVDNLKQNSLTFAKIQAQHNVKGTYYFRTIPQSYDEQVIKEMASLGHEIGYHYETMDTSRGNVDKAYDEFCTNLQTFRKIVPVTTICMHGSPMSKYDNRDIWKKYDYRQIGLIAEPYFDTNFNQIFYLTDTGRRWDGEKVSIRDKAMKGSEATNPAFTKLHFKTTFDIIEAANQNLLPSQIMFTFHPQRWTDNSLLWTKELLLQNIKNTVKFALLKLKD
jgi:hypothetical protein